MKNVPTKIILHHTGGSDANPLQDSSGFTFLECERLHRDRFNFVSTLGFWTGYHYYIEKDGKVYQARADNEEGAHTIGQNTSSIGICMAGNFDLTLPTLSQKIALKSLLLKKTKEWGIKDIFPHREFANKTCYGNKLPDMWGTLLISDTTMHEVTVKPDDEIIRRTQLTLIEKLWKLIEQLKANLKK